MARYHLQAFRSEWE